MVSYCFFTITANARVLPQAGYWNYVCPSAAHPRIWYLKLTEIFKK